MSEMGAKSFASAAIPAFAVFSVHERPSKACSHVAARFGVAAMPPKHTRTLIAAPFSRSKLKTPQTAEMSSSKRLEIL